MLRGSGRTGSGMDKGEAFVQAVARWKDRLWMNHWLIKITDSPEQTKEQGSPDALAVITPNPSYWRADLYYDGPEMEKHEDVDTTALHEVAHLVIAPLVGWAADLINDVVPRGADEVYAKQLKVLNEQVTTDIERIARKGVKEWAE